MDTSLVNLRVLAGNMLSLYQDWSLLDKESGMLLADFSGSQEPFTEIERGIDSLYLAPASSNGYHTLPPSTSCDSILQEIQDTMVSYNEIVASSMRIQLQTSSVLASLDTVSNSTEIMELATFVDKVSTMLLKEYAVKTSIVSDLKQDTPSATIAVYFTTWKSKPHIDEETIEKFKQTLTVSEQILRNK